MTNRSPLNGHPIELVEAIVRLTNKGVVRPENCPIIERSTYYTWIRKHNKDFPGRPNARMNRLMKFLIKRINDEARQMVDPTVLAERPRAGHGTVVQFPKSA